MRLLTLLILVLAGCVYNNEFEVTDDVRFTCAGHTWCDLGGDQHCGEFLVEEQACAGDNTRVVENFLGLESDVVGTTPEEGEDSVFLFCAGDSYRVFPICNKAPDVICDRTTCNTDQVCAIVRHSDGSDTETLCIPKPIDGAQECPGGPSECATGRCATLLTFAEPPGEAWERRTACF